MAETYWLLLSQYEIYGEKIEILKKQRRFLNLLCYYPYIPSSMVVGYRE